MLSSSLIFMCYLLFIIEYFFHLFFVCVFHRYRSRFIQSLMWFILLGLLLFIWIILPFLMCLIFRKWVTIIHKNLGLIMFILCFSNLGSGLKFIVLVKIKVDARERDSLVRRFFFDFWKILKFWYLCPYLRGLFNFFGQLSLLTVKFLIDLRFYMKVCLQFFLFAIWCFLLFATNRYLKVFPSRVILV